MDEQIITSEALASMQSDYLGRYLLDNAKFLEEMYHKLKGESLTEELQDINGEKVLVPVWKQVKGADGNPITTPIINEKGLNVTMYLLNLSLTSNSATGKMDDDVLRTLAFKTYMLLVKDYMLHEKEYGFESRSQLYMLAHLIFKNVLLHLSKSTDMALLKELCGIL